MSVFLVLSAYANPANCDSDMSDDQRFQKELCSAHVGCGLVMGIMDTCIGVKSFLGKLGLGSRRDGAGLSDRAFESALEESGVPRPSLSNCFTSFDRTLCRQFLGLEKAPDQVRSLTVERELDIKKQGLEMGLTLVRNRAGFWGDAESGLQGCAEARTSGDWTNACARAERLVVECERARGVWMQRRDELRVEAQRQQIAAMVEWAARNDMPLCPSRVPGTKLTPAQAMVQWGQERERAQSQTGTQPAAPSTAAAGAQVVNAGAAADPLANLPRRQGGSGLATFQQAAGQEITPGLKPSSPDAVQADASTQQFFSVLGSVAGAGIAGGATGLERRQAMLNAFDQATGGGSAGMEGGAGMGAGSGALPEIAPSGSEDADCLAAFRQLQQQFNTAKARLPPTGARPGLEAQMWLNSQAMATIRRYCPASPRFQREFVVYERRFNDSARTCSAVATDRCVPRLP